MDLLSALGIIRERINNELQIKLKENNIDINCGHIWLLSAVYMSNGPIEIKELVRILEKKKSTISDMINVLIKNGYLIKTQSKEDKRVYYIQTTDYAQSIKNDILDIVDSINHKMFMKFSKDELLDFSNSISKIVDGLS